MAENEKRDTTGAEDRVEDNTSSNPDSDTPVPCTANLERLRQKYAGTPIKTYNDAEGW